MGWENILQQPSWCPQLIVSNPDALVSDLQATSSSTQVQTVLRNHFNASYTGATTSLATNSLFAGDSNNYIESKVSGSTVVAQARINGQQPTPYFAQDSFMRSNTQWAYFALVNHDTHQGYFSIVQKITTITYPAGSSPKITDSRVLSYMYTILTGNPYVAYHTGKGGGATHIANVDGLLSTLSSNLSDILIVSGGGGGGYVVNDTAYDGADAGGVSGSGESSGNQSTGYRFGQGESNLLLSGGGSGLYGGYKSTLSSGAGAGSGYIGNELLINKKMVGYNVPTSDNENDLTESVNTYSENHDESLPQSGNGYARISYVGQFCPDSQWRFASMTGGRILRFTCSEIYIDSYWEDILKICENSDDYPYFYNLKKEVKACFSDSYTLNTDYPKALFGGGGDGAGVMRYYYKRYPEPRQLIITKNTTGGYSKTYEIDMQYDDSGNLVTSYAIFAGYNHTTQKGLIVIIEYNSYDNTYRFIDDEVPEPNEYDYIILTTPIEPEP